MSRGIKIAGAVIFVMVVFLVALRIIERHQKQGTLALPPTQFPTPSSVKNLLLEPAPAKPTTPHSFIAYQPGDYRESITVDGRSRTYLLHVPAGFRSSSRYPLVATFHGGGGSGDIIARHTGFSSVADREGFIGVFPDGISHNWNDGRGTTDAEKLGVDDVKFVRALLESLKTKLPIDASRIYASGLSNGGIFTERLACDMADVFAAVASDVGPIASNYVPNCKPAAPISVAAIQGDSDPLVPIQGGEEGWRIHLGDGGLLESAANTMQFWAAKNSCPNPPAVSNLPPQVNDGTSVTETRYSGCRNSTEVRYYIVHGMGHVWPPNPPQVLRKNNPTSRNIDATETFWSFFKTHPKINLTPPPPPPPAPVPPPPPPPSALRTPSPSLASRFSPLTASLLPAIEAALANIQNNLSLLRDLFPRP